MNVFFSMQLQQLVVSGELACSKEDAASLACIQLRIEETWAPPGPATPTPTPVPTPVHQIPPSAPSLKVHSPNQLSIGSTGSSKQSPSPNRDESLMNETQCGTNLSKGDDTTSQPLFSFSNSNSTPSSLTVQSVTAVQGAFSSPSVTPGGGSISSSPNHQISKVRSPSGTVSINNQSNVLSLY